MRVTTEQGRGTRLRLYGDGEYLFSLDSSTWYSFAISDGEEITSAQLEQLKSVALERQAYALALRLLTSRAHSERELYDKLIKKHEPQAAEYAVERCRSLGFLDDEDFAARFAAELNEKKKYAPSRIRQELLRRGIAPEIIQKTLDSLSFNADSSIADIIEKKYKNCMDDEKSRRRMINGLMRMGYSYGQITGALKAMQLDGNGEFDEY